MVVVVVAGKVWVVEEEVAGEWVAGKVGEEVAWEGAGGKVQVVGKVEGGAHVGARGSSNPACS